MDLLIYYSKGAKNGELVSQTQSKDNLARVSWNTKDAKSANCNSVAESHCITEALLKYGWNDKDMAVNSPP